MSAGFVQQYRERFAGAFSTWEPGVGGARWGDRGLEAPLDEVFVLPRGCQEGGTEVSLEAEAVLARRQPVVVLGPAGAGKGVWLRWLFRRLLEREDALPLWVELGELGRRWRGEAPQGAARSLERYLLEQIEEHLGAGQQRWLEGALWAIGERRPILLMDGWDELGGLGEEVRSKLLGFLRAWSGVRVVVTSRPEAAHLPGRRDGFELLELAPFALAEVERLAARFYRVAWRGDPLRAREDAARFVLAAQRTPSLAALSARGLWLALALAAHQGEPMPDRRALLYQRCLEVALEALPRGQGEGWRPEEPARRLEALAALGFALQRGAGPAGALEGRPWAELERRLPAEWDQGQRRGFLRWLVVEAGVLVEGDGGALALSQPGFQEHLAALHLSWRADSAQERVALCQQHQEELSWWEPLRLWAALVSARDPGWLEPVLGALARGDGAGFWLAGAFYADGLGDEGGFVGWARRLRDALWRPWEPWTGGCARAWAGSHQEGRRLALREILREAQQSAPWLPWLRCREWGAEAGLAGLEEPPAALCASRALLAAMSGEPLDRERLAMGRLLTGAHALWPVEPWPLALLLAWPGPRRVAATRLQALLSLGATGALWDEMARATLCPLPPAQAALARALELRLLADEEGRDPSAPRADRGARALARLLARYAPGDRALELARLASPCAVAPSARAWDVAMARLLPRFLAHNLAHGALGDAEVARALARSWCAQLGADHEDLLISFFTLELASSPRALAHDALARLEGGAPPAQLIAAACAGAPPPSPLPEMDPLWPALARALRHAATPEDLALLEALAQRPTLRSGPLQWGLQAFARGDLLLESGAWLTLDALCARLQIAAPPLLGPED